MKKTMRMAVVLMISTLAAVNTFAQITESSTGEEIRPIIEAFTAQMDSISEDGRFVMNGYAVNPIIKERPDGKYYIFSFRENGNDNDVYTVELYPVEDGEGIMLLSVSVPSKEQDIRQGHHYTGMHVTLGVDCTMYKFDLSGGPEKYIQNIEVVNWLSKVMVIFNSSVYGK